MTNSRMTNARSRLNSSFGNSSFRLGSAGVLGRILASRLLRGPEQMKNPRTGVGPMRGNAIVRHSAGPLDSTHRGQLLDPLQGQLGKLLLTIKVD